MTLEEFKQKIEGVSDRRLLRMLERAQADGLQVAIALIEGERVKRAEIAAQAAAAELTSQIRPLEEVLGRSFGQPATAKPKLETPRVAPPITLAAAPQTTQEALFAHAPLAALPKEVASEPSRVEALPELSAASAISKAEREPEDIMPLTLTAKDWGAFAAPEATSEEEDSASARGNQHPHRGWIIFAIILLMLAGFFAIWRALVG